MVNRSEMAAKQSLRSGEGGSRGYLLSRAYFGFASEVRNLGWTQSEPPRGSGWVRRRHFRNIKQIECVYDVPTRYREVVLTVSKPGSDI